MRKPLKIILYVFTATSFLVLVTALCLPFIIDANDFKAQIEAAVKDRTGRTLTIKGNLELSVFPWLGISTGEITLSNAKGFKAHHFAKIQQSELNVKLIPLFSSQLEVSEMVFKGLRLHLSKNKEGISNWDDLKDSSSEDSKSSNPLAILAIAGLLIEDAAIVWDDQQAKQHTEIQNLSLKVNKLAFNEAIPLKLSLKLLNKEPALEQLINFSGNLILEKTLKRFQLKDIQLNIVNKGDFISTGSLNVQLLANILFDKETKYLKLSGLKINSDELRFKADLEAHFKEQVKVTMTAAIESFNLANFLDKMEIKRPKMVDEKALTRLELGFKLQADPQQVSINDLMIKLDESILKGTSQISNFSEPAIKFNLSLDRINADRYLPPKDEKSPEKVAKAPKPVAKKPEPAEPVTKATPTTPASAAAISASLFPVETLRKLNATGQIVIEQLKINNLKMQGLTLKLDAKKGIVQGKQSIKQFYQGSYQGGFNLNVNPNLPVLILDEQLNNVQIAPLLTDMKGKSKMTGIANINAKLMGRGNTTEAIKSSLNGQMNFLFKDSVIKGFNIQKIIDKGKALLAGNLSAVDGKKNQSLFSKISASATVRNGLIQSNDLLALSSRLKITGHGNASLITEKLDYRLKALRVKQKATATMPEVLSSQPVFINIAGTFDDPSYRLDVAAMLLEKNKDKIDKVLNKLDKKVPKEIGNLLKKLF